MAINPLQAPINYASQMVDLTPAFAGLGQAVAQRRERTQEQARQKEAAAIKAQYATDLQATLANPTQSSFNKLILTYPQQRQALESARQSFGEERLTNEFKQGFSVSMALENNNPTVAMEQLKTIIAAKKNAGEPTQIYDQVFAALESGNTKAAQAGVNMALSTMDPERFEKTVNAQVAAAGAPSKLSQQVAEASKAVTEAEVAVATAPDDIAKAKAQRELSQAQAKSAALDAKYAERAALNKLEQDAAALGLTKAQTGSALAQIRKLGVDTQQAALQLEAFKASGGVDPKEKFAQEEKIRKEYQVRNKVYTELATTYSNIESSALAKSGPGDVALITGFMKMLDPGSVVRETEFATARDTAGLYERLRNSLAKAESGVFLQDSQRKEFTNLAKQYLDSAQKKAGQDKTALGVVVKNYRLNPDNVFGPETAAAPAPSPNSVTVGGQTFNRPANFTDAQWSAYKQSVGAQ